MPDIAIVEDSPAAVERLREFLGRFSRQEPASLHAELFEGVNFTAPGPA